MPRASCTIEDCEQPQVGRGWCNRHYLRWSKHGDPLAGRPTPRKPIDHDDGTRTCLDCQGRKSLTDFGLDHGNRRATCKPCRSAKSSAWYQANQTRQLERHRARKAADPTRVRQQDSDRYYRHRAKRIGLTVEAGNRRRALLAQVPSDPGITPQSLRERDGDLCHYCRATLDFAPGDGRTYLPTKATVEHVVALTAGGHHTWDNVVLACWQCNVRKQATPVDAWLEVVVHASSQDDHRTRTRLGA